MRKIVVLYPYDTGENAFSGGVPKVAVSNLIAINNIGDIPYLVLPEGNTGLIKFIKENYAYCHVVPVKFKHLSLFSDTKGFFRYLSILKNLVRFYVGYKYLKKAIRKISPDIIHFHEVINFPILSISPYAKVVLHLHSYRFTSYGRMLDYIIKRINYNADIVISPTKSILQALSHSLKTPSVVVDTPYLEIKDNEKSIANNNIIDELKVYKKSGKIVFSFVGRICSIKRINHFIDAINNLPALLKEKVFFSIVGGTNNVGDVQYKDFLTSKVIEYELQDIVKFHGYVNQIESILPYIDYGVILSESEAVPMIGIEYMRFNIPIIGYNAPGISDFLIDKVNGFLIPNSNIEELSNVVEKILNKKYSQLDFKSLIPQTYERHTIDKFSVALNKLYSSL